MVFGSDVVITICQELQDTVTTMGAGDRALLIENVMGGDVEEAPRWTPPTCGGAGASRQRRRSSLYTGTFEAYQGLDLLVEAMAIVSRRHPEARVLVVGGESRAGRGAARDRARQAADAMVFTGQQPARDIAALVPPPTCSCRRASPAPTRR